MRAWAAEVNNDGNFKRPWAQPDHPLHRKAASIGAAVLEDQEIAERGMPAVLKEIDRLMNKESPKPTAAAVLSNDGNVRPPEKRVRLSEDQKYAARMMGVSEDRYLASLKALGKS